MANQIIVDKVAFSGKVPHMQIRLNKQNKTWIVRLAKENGVSPTLTANFVLSRHYLASNKKIQFSLGDAIWFEHDAKKGKEKL